MKGDFFVPVISSESTFYPRMSKNKSISDYTHCFTKGKHTFVKYTCTITNSTKGNGTEETIIEKDDFNSHLIEWGYYNQPLCVNFNGFLVIKTLCW